MSTKMAAKTILFWFTKIWILLLYSLSMKMHEHTPWLLVYLEYMTNYSRCEQYTKNTKIAAQIAAKLILFKLFIVGNASIAFLTGEGIKVHTKIAGCDF